MKKGPFLAGMLIAALLADPRVRRKIRRLFTSHFDDRPTIRVRSGSIHVEAHESEFEDVSPGSKKWNHTHSHAGHKGRPQFAVVVDGVGGELWAGVASRAEVTYGNSHHVVFKARPGDFVRVEAEGNMQKQGPHALEDTSATGLTKLEIDSKDVGFVPANVLILP